MPRRLPKIKIPKALFSGPLRVLFFLFLFFFFNFSFDMLGGCLKFKTIVCCWDAKGMGVKGAATQRLIMAPGLVQAVHLWVSTVVLGCQDR